MQSPFSLAASNRNNNLWQALFLLLPGAAFLVMAKIGFLNPYPVGELCFGIGILAVAPLNTHRLLAVGWLTTMIGLAGFLVFGHVLPTNQLLAAHVVAIGFGFLGIREMMKRGLIDVGTLTPGLLIVGVGIVEYLQAAQLTPAHFLSFALSLWLPGYGLCTLGLALLATSRRA